DYVRTGENSDAIMRRLEPTIGRMMAKFGLHLDAAARAAMRAEFSPEPSRGLLAHLGAGSPDPLAALREAGLTDGLIERLRERAVACSRALLGPGWPRAAPAVRARAATTSGSSTPSSD